MKELWEQAISLLPTASKVDCFYIEFRPWIKDKAHLYRVFFRAHGAFASHHVPPEKVYYPLWITGFGNSPEEALQNFITEGSKNDNHR